METVRVALNDVAIGLKDISKNSDLFADWIAHVKYPKLLEIRSTLAAVLAHLDDELPSVHKGSRYKEPVKYSYLETDGDLLDDDEVPEPSVDKEVEGSGDKDIAPRWFHGVLKLRFWK